MHLTDVHIAYESNCRNHFVGQKICGIIYAEIKSFADVPEPGYNTHYPDLDTLDHSFYIQTEQQTIYIFWDNSFVSYGLQSKQIDPVETTNQYEQKWNVSVDPKWVNLIGQTIHSIEIVWYELQSSDSNHYFYPQTFEIKTDSGATIILSAAELDISEENKVFLFTDNLLVTTNRDLAKQLKLVV